nr:hypothetical protein [Mangrovicoccus ximenensis]
MAHQPGKSPVVAQMVVAAQAGRAGPAAVFRLDRDPVARGESSHAGAGLGHRAAEFMADDERGRGPAQRMRLPDRDRQRSFGIFVQVAAADAAIGDLQPDLALRERGVIRIWNGRGGLLAVAEPAAELREGVVQLSTGGWYAPAELPGAGLTCVNGNPNAVTSDIGASRLSQGCAGQLSLVSVELWQGEVPPAVPQEAILPRP